MMYNNAKRLLSVETLGYSYANMDLTVMPRFKYDETTANVTYLTDFMKYFRTTYQITIGRVVEDPNRFGCANWWFNRFVGSRSGRPMRLTRSYMIFKYGDVSKIKNFDKLRVLEQFSSYPGLSDRTRAKLDQGVVFPGYEMPFEPSYMAINPSDIDGERTKSICLDMMLKSLNESYKAVVHKHNWHNVEDLLAAYQNEYPGFTFFKAGMNVVEQTLAHLDSAGYYLASVLDRNRNLISGAVNVEKDYVCSFDYREQLESKYDVKHYFKDLLVSKKKANEQKMCYIF